MTIRFWSRSGEPVPINQEGYLHARAHWKWLSRQLFTLMDLSAEPCVLLLGEPGMGKTRSITQHVEELRGYVSSRDQVALLMPQHDPLLHTLRDVFQTQAREEPESVLHLFIDSLDEYLWLDRAAAAHLGRMLAQLPAPLRARLRLRIVCRTQQFPKALLERLSQLWNNSVTCYELAPLQYEDVEREAKQLPGSVGQHFLRELTLKRLGGLASRPITLNMLLKLVQCGALPTNRTDIYARGCKLLCTEPDPERTHITHRSDSQDPARRLALAECAAAAMLLCLKQSIWTGSEPASAPDEVTVFDLVESMNQLSEPPLRVTDNELRSLMEDSALFAKAGSARSGFSHQTYQEFLTASWMAKQPFHDSEQLLLLAPAASPGQVAQPFYEVAAWLASLREGVMERLSRQQPKLLLRSDLTAANPEWRRQICGQLLAQYADQKLHIIDWDVGNYHVLAHPELAPQLEPFLASRQKNHTVRQIAIYIAHGCREHALAPALLQLAQDASEEPKLRRAAVRALIDLNDARVLTELRPLVDLLPEQDPDDEIKGMVLSALWQHGEIKPASVLSLLSPPRQPNLHGNYQGFIAELGETWPEDALPDALVWVSAQPERERLTFSFRRLLDAILRKGFQRIIVPAVRAALVKAVSTRIEHYEDPFANEDIPADGDLLDSSDDHRRELIKALVETSEISQSILQRVGMGIRRQPWIRKSDLDWLLAHLAEASIPRRVRWARLIGDLTHIYHDSLDDRVYEASCRYTEMLESLPGDFKPVVIGSDAARMMQEQYQQRLELKRKRQKRAAARDVKSPPPPPLPERIALAFSHSAEQREHPWCRLEYELRFDKDGNAKHDLDTVGVLKGEGWTESDAVTQKRLLEAAVDYLKTTLPPSEPYQYHHNVTTTSWQALLGFRALQLLFEAAPESLRTLDGETFARWMPVLVNYPLASGWSHLPKLLGVAYRQASDSFLAALIARCERESASLGISLRMDHLRECWDEHLARRMSDWMVASVISPSLLHSLLTALLDAQPELFHALAQSLIPAKVHEPGLERERAIAAGSVLLRSGTSTAWDMLAPAVKSDPQYILSLVEFGSWYREETWPDSLPDNALGILYILLRRRYPDREDDGTPKRLTSDEVRYLYQPREVPPERVMEELRDRLLSVLIKRPRQSSLAALESMIAAFPQSSRLAWSREWLTETIRTAALEAETQQRPMEQLIARISQLRRASRKELGRILRTDSDLDAFCLDYFPLVHLRFSNGMDREQKMSILLSAVDPEELRRCLASRSTDPNSQ